MLTVSHLKAEHFWLGWLPIFRIGLLAAGGLASLWLVRCLVGQAPVGVWRRGAAGLAMTWPIGLMSTVWTLVFFIW
jgi:hypothetical protein